MLLECSESFPGPTLNPEPFIMLRELRNYIKENGYVSSSEIAIHLHMDKSAAEGMAEVLIKRGDVIKVDSLPKCKGCVESTCCEDTFYKWEGE